MLPGNLTAKAPPPEGVDGVLAPDQFLTMVCPFPSRHNPYLPSTLSEAVEIPIVPTRAGGAGGTNLPNISFNPSIQALI